MHSSRLLQNSLAALALALVLAAPARALEASPAVESAPPALPDSLHVPNGCHLSTLAYLTRFLAQYPQEAGEALVIEMHNDAGVRWNHTIAVISWHGQTWCRDEYFGVFALDCRYSQKPVASRLALKAEAALSRHSRSQLRSGAVSPLTPPPTDLSAQQRAADVETAASKVPFPATVFWVKSGQHEVPVAFFRPNSSQIAVYEPLHGTCLAECACRDDAKVVSLVAARLGLRPDSVRAELPAAHAVLVAAAR